MTTIAAKLAPDERDVGAAEQHRLGEGTKCGVGLTVWTTYCSQTGMLSIGVLLPDRSCVTISTGMASRPNWPIVVASVPSMMPSAATTSA